MKEVYVMIPEGAKPGDILKVTQDGTISWVKVARAVEPVAKPKITRKRNPGTPEYRVTPEFAKALSDMTSNNTFISYKKVRAKIKHRYWCALATSYFKTIGWTHSPLAGGWTNRASDEKTPQPSLDLKSNGVGLVNGVGQ